MFEPHQLQCHDMCSQASMVKFPKSIAFLEIKPHKETIWLVMLWSSNEYELTGISSKDPELVSSKLFETKWPQT